MSAPNLTPRERAELVAFAERLERGWAEFGCAVSDQDWEAARIALDTIGQVHVDATDSGLERYAPDWSLWGRT